MSEVGSGLRARTHGLRICDIWEMPMEPASPHMPFQVMNMLRLTSRLSACAAAAHQLEGRRGVTEPPFVPWLWRTWGQRSFMKKKEPPLLVSSLSKVLTQRAHCFSLGSAGRSHDWNFSTHCSGYLPAENPTLLLFSWTPGVPPTQLIYLSLPVSALWTDHRA